MLFEFKNVSVDIDVKETRDYYSKNNSVNNCSCSGCRNYRQYIENCESEIKDFFVSLGIDDMNCITEIIPFDVERERYEKDHRMLYMGFYHVKGQIIKTNSDQDEIKITEKFNIEISDEISMLPDGFPKPCLQINFSAYIPWVLDEENEYIV